MRTRLGMAILVMRCPELQASAAAVRRYKRAINCQNCLGRFALAFKEDLESFPEIVMRSGPPFLSGYLSDR